MIYLASRAPDCLRHVASRARAVVARGGRRGARRVSGGRFARPPARHVATARRVVALAVLALVLLVPSVAHAEVDWEEKTANYTAIVAPYEYSADGRVAAFVEYLGYDWTSLTSDAQSYIIGHLPVGTSFGNALHDGSIKNLMYEYRDETQWPIVSYWATVFGLPNMWYISLSSGNYNSARVEYDQALAAWVADSGYGGGSGGGSGGNLGTPIPSTLQLDQNTGYYVYQYIENGLSVSSVRPMSNLVPVTVNFKNSSSLNNFLSSHGLNHYLVLIASTGVLDSSSNGSGFFLFASDSEISVSYDSTYVWTKPNSFAGLTGYEVHCRSGNLYYATPDGPLLRDKTTSFSFDCNTSSMTKSNTGDYRLGQRYYTDANATNYLVLGLIGYNDVGNPVGPTYPEPPQPPEIPEPDPPETRPIDDPGITLPPINFPDLVLPDIDYTVQTPTGTDVIPYLKKIIANQQDIAAFLSDAFDILDRDLDNIGSALGEHCNHLQTQMQKQAYWLATELQDMFDGLEVGISNYLYRVQTKLLQGIGWEFDNLSQDVISWLKRIYSRLGGNGISKPDPTTDPVGFWDWLIKQFSDFFEDLFGKSTDGLSSLFDSLKEFFPFSLPWDILALLGLFVHEPVTPVFDLPMPVPSIVSDTRMYLIHVDCHSWDGTMQIVRALEFVFFAYHLMRMVPSWFNEIKVSGM